MVFVLCIMQIGKTPLEVAQLYNKHSVADYLLKFGEYTLL